MGLFEKNAIAMSLAIIPFGCFLGVTGLLIQLSGLAYIFYLLNYLTFCDE